MDQIEQFLREGLGIVDDLLIEQGKIGSYILDISKGKHLARQGDALPGVVFLISGMFRFYYVDSTGHEHTDCFCGSYGYPVMPAIDVNMPLPINVQALEDSTVLVISIELVQKLLDDNLEIIRLYNRLLIQSLTQHWEDKMALHQYDAAQRYAWFLKRYDGLIDRVPHVHIASFLNISPVTLSRLRKNMKMGKLNHA
jgi:CRP-like cAMP-binding protein